MIPQFGVRALFALMLFAAIVSAVFAALGVPVGIVICIVFLFSCFAAFASAGDWQSHALLAVPLLCLVAFVDLNFGVLVDFRLTCLAACGFAVVIAGPFLMANNERKNQVLAGLVALGFIAMFFLIQTPRKSFRRAFVSIEMGMNAAEVRAAIRTQFGERQPVENDGVSAMSFILDPKDGRYNAESIVVELHQGRAIRKQYYAD